MIFVRINEVFRGVCRFPFRQRGTGGDLLWAGLRACGVFRLDNSAPRYYKRHACIERAASREAGEDVWEWHMIEEERALRALRKIVEGTATRLKDPNIEREDAARVMDLTRVWVSKVFPDKLQAYDAIYKPRFENIYQKEGGSGDKG